MDVNNKVNFFCRSVQVQRLGAQLEPRGSDTLEFHYAAVCVCTRVCVCVFMYAKSHSRLGLTSRRGSKL